MEVKRGTVGVSAEDGEQFSKGLKCGGWAILVFHLKMKVGAKALGVVSLV